MRLLCHIAVLMFPFFVFVQQIARLDEKVCSHGFLCDRNSLEFLSLHDNRSVQASSCNKHYTVWILPCHFTWHQYPSYPSKCTSNQSWFNTPFLFCISLYRSIGVLPQSTQWVFSNICTDLWSLFGHTCPPNVWHNHLALSSPFFFLFLYSSHKCSFLPRLQVKIETHFLNDNGCSENVSEYGNTHTHKDTHRR